MLKVKRDINQQNLKIVDLHVCQMRIIFTHLKLLMKSEWKFQLTNVAVKWLMIGSHKYNISLELMGFVQINIIIGLLFNSNI